MGDRCSSQANDYQSAVNTLENELGTIDNRVRSANSSCGTELSSLGSAQKMSIEPSSGNHICDLYRSYKNKLPIESLIKGCMNSMSESECRKCLGQ